MTPAYVGRTTSGCFPLDVSVLPCITSLFSGWASQRWVKRLLLFPPLHITAFIHVLHTALCSSLGTGTPFSSAVRPKYTHTMLLAFFLTKLVLPNSGNPAISLRTKSSKTHVTSCLIRCRVASPIVLLYTGETIYHDKNAHDMIIAYPNLSRFYCDTSLQPG